MTLRQRGYLIEGITAKDIKRRVEVVRSSDGDKEKARDLARWFEKNFLLGLARTPKGQKDLKQSFERMVRLLSRWAWFDQTEGEWIRIKDRLGDVVKYFSVEGGSDIPKEMKGRHATYLNIKGFNKKSMEGVVRRLDAVFGDIKGWRKKALTAGGGLVVAFAGAKDFRGTSSGVYKREKDVLYIRATPKVLKRAGRYGSPEYIIIHELGHRYEHKVGISDFSGRQWYTTKYSMISEEEAFAELFALGHFGIKKAHREWNPEIQDRFEKRME